MQFIKNNFWTLFMVAVFALLGMSGEALAADGAGSGDVAGSSVMDTATKKAINVFGAIKTIIFVVGGFGLVGLAFAAIFGKINWKWFASLATGLAILAAAGSIVKYATGGDVDGSGGTYNLGDSFGSSTGGSI